MGEIGRTWIDREVASRACLRNGDALVADDDGSDRIGVSCPAARNPAVPLPVPCWPKTMVIQLTVALVNTGASTGAGDDVECPCSASLWKRDRGFADSVNARSALPERRRKLDRGESAARSYPASSSSIFFCSGSRRTMRKLRIWPARAGSRFSRNALGRSLLPLRCQHRSERGCQPCPRVLPAAMEASRRSRGAGGADSFAQLHLRPSAGDVGNAACHHVAFLVSAMYSSIEVGWSCFSPRRMRRSRGPLEHPRAHAALLEYLLRMVDALIGDHSPMWIMAQCPRQSTKAPNLVRLVTGPSTTVPAGNFVSISAQDRPAPA
jgi:hypothetical protein